MVISIFGIKSQRDNIGHEAHMGGALVGVFVTMIMQPSIITTNWWIILLVLVPIISFLILIVRKPEVLLIDNYWGTNRGSVSKLKEKFKKKKEPEVTLDYLLDKIRKKGMGSLTTKEKELLDRFKDEM